MSFDPIGKTKYMNKNMFVMCHIGKYELVLGIDVDEIRVNNKMHACYRFKVGHWRFQTQMEKVHNGMIPQN